MQVKRINLTQEDQKNAFLKLLNEYMLDQMGLKKSLDPDQGEKIISDLLEHPSFIGFFVVDDQRYIALANCFVNYSTFKARKLLNIHDFVVHPSYRRKGAGFFLLDGIEQYARRNGFCKINLEVREDNTKARRLYKKFGFDECQPPMDFWEKPL